LRALKAQRVHDGFQLEIVVVDNNSSDRTKDVVEEIAQDSTWPIRYVFEGQQGVSYARNRGIGEAKGPILICTDDDVLPEPNWAQALYEGFEKYNADCVGGKILPLWLEPAPAWLLSEELKKQVCGGLALLDRGSQVIIGDAGDRNLLYGANMAFRKTVFGDVGMFRTDLGPIGTACSRGDDTNMLERILKAGKRVVYTPDAVVHHKVAPARMHAAYFRRWKFQAGRSQGIMSAGPRGGIPKWLVRDCVSSGFGALWAYSRRARAQGLRRELEFWACLGRIVGAFTVT